MQLIKLLPDYYENNVTMNLLQEILTRATDNLDDRLEGVIANCFVTTADAMLSRYENAYGIPVDLTKSDAYRRERIIAKLAGAGTSTKEMIQQVASSYANGEIEVIEDNENYSFEIHFVGERGIPGNMENLKATIEEIKPAHLAVMYVYTYNTWANIRDSELTWSQVAGYTWEELRTVNV